MVRACVTKLTRKKIRTISPATINRSEFNLKSPGGAGLVESLNYGGSTIAGVIPSGNVIRVPAIEDWFSDVTDPWGQWDNGFLKGCSDDSSRAGTGSAKAATCQKEK
jgi:hypothetical protein